MRKTVVALLAVFLYSLYQLRAQTFLAVKSGGKATCLNASWVIENWSETKGTVVHINVGTLGYSWNKNFDRTLEPGGFLANSLEPKSTFENKGPGDLLVNCQAHRVENANRVEWKKDAGSHKTYQSNYHLDHVQPEITFSLVWVSLRVPSADFSVRMVTVLVADLLEKPIVKI